MATKKKNYLNNKDILKEIHKSKMSYCYVMDDTFFDYDAIVSFGDSITTDTIEEAKKGKASRLSLQKFNEHLESDPKSTRKASEFSISPDSISKDDVTIRIMTFDHIPLAKRKKKTISREADHYTRCNFPPFIHVSTMASAPPGHSTVVDEVGDQWVEVARSHWKGDLTNGGFDVKNGNLTDKLARMMVMLCHRYSMQSNWRGYSYVDEMQSSALEHLVKIGLQFDESKGQNPFAYYTTSLLRSFRRVFNIEKKNQNIRDDLLQESGQMPSFTRQLDHELSIIADREESLNEDDTSFQDDDNA